ncbi:MAG: NUDIX domain-containing protein, partial [Curvibacter sp.]
MSSADHITPLSKLPNFDPRAVPVLGVDAHLPAVPPERLQADFLRGRFAAPPDWQPEVRAEPRFTLRQPAQAAVLVPLVARPEPTLLLTQRTSHLSNHSGQIAFPGGKVDETDAGVVEAALREAEEEVGLARDYVQVLGTLPVYT